MTNPTAKTKKNSYDIGIIGGGFTGLLCGMILSQNYHVALLEGLDRPGGLLKSVEDNEPFLINRFNFFPDSLINQSALQYFFNQINRVEELIPIDTPPVTHENGGFIPFIGFGALPTPDYFKELQYYTSHRSIEIKSHPHEWIQSFLSRFKGDLLNSSHVTKIIIENDTVDHLVVNGSKKIYAKNYIFCGNLKNLSQLLPTHCLGTKEEQKITKAKTWSTLSLDLLHNQELTTNKNIHVFCTTEKNQTQTLAFLGQFSSTQTSENNSQQASHWFTFVSPRLDEDTDELTTRLLKKMKNQIKKAYPSALKTVIKERIVFAQDTHGKIEMKLKANQTLPNLKNFWIGSSLIHNQQNLIGSIEQSRLIISALKKELTENKPFVGCQIGDQVINPFVN